ncbi:zinc finger protein 512B [Rhinichthys klamathensis goyatoka]|uniref:zinc finger protein 512B n=1 Tax=Rhinichthys klamathensis goyatoka TaxID=3034132 RepID=UPI0024B4EF96|nr:zinc finger protein 512B [Rhinichthys klamathensis goyatoka]XP_056091294.1 zinc finger protein 512B [Rhinichthys klamathensis goyatoka]
MDTSSGARVVKPSSGMSKGRSAKQAHPAEMARMGSTENDNHGSSYNEKSESKKKGRPRVEVQELRIIPAHMMVQWKEEFKSRSRVKCPSSGCWLEFPSIYGLKYHYQRCQGATIAEKLSHRCPYCEAVFATKVRLQKHKLWNHPERVTLETRSDPKSEPKQQKSPVKGNAKKRPMENSPPSPVFFKVKKTQEVSQRFQNGECAPQRPDRRQRHSSQQQGTSLDTGDSESEEDSLPPPFPEEDPERMKHRRKQKTPKKFTGEQPSISGTFGLKGMNKVEEKLKAGRMKRAEGTLFTEESQRKQSVQAHSRKDPAAISSVPPAEAQWQNTISERGEVVCPTCSVVTRKTVPGLKKHMEICQKLRDALKCQQCQKQFRSKAGLDYHSMADHTKPSASENVSGEEQEERERLRRILKQTGRIKCPNEGCSAHFSSLMSYQYHQKRCGRELPDTQKPVFLCQHCGKTYRSKAGRDYHLRTEHPVTHSLTSEDWKQEDSKDEEDVLEEEEEEEEDEEQEEPELKKARGKAKERVDEQLEKMEERKEEKTEVEELLDLERTPSGRVRRRSAQVAVFHLQEIAEDELAKDWGNKRRIKDDLVPDIKRLNYTRPGLPNFSPETVESWKNEVKEKGFICCPNCNCEAIYSSVSGLKAHLASCNKGGGDVGKYTCLLCQKEFNSESGVKYHISKTHSQNWFRASTNEVANNKRKEPESNGLQKDMKNVVPGKKRGRKPKDHNPVTASFPAETKSFTSAPVPIPPQIITSETRTPAPNPITHSPTTPSDPVDSGNPAQTRDTPPPIKKRAKPKKALAPE